MRRKGLAEGRRILDVDDYATALVAVLVSRAAEIAAELVRLAAKLHPDVDASTMRQAFEIEVLSLSPLLLPYC